MKPISLELGLKILEKFEYKVMILEGKARPVLKGTVAEFVSWLNDQLKEGVSVKTYADKLKENQELCVCECQLTVHARTKFCDEHLKMELDDGDEAFDNYANNQISRKGGE